MNLLNNLSVKTKIFCLSLLAVFATIFVGLIGFYFINDINDLRHRSDWADILIGSIAKTELEQQVFLNAPDPAVADSARQSLERASVLLKQQGQSDERIQDLGSLIEDYRSKFDAMVSLSLKLKQLVQQHGELSTRLKDDVRKNLVWKIEQKKAMALISAKSINQNEEAMSGIGTDLLNLASQLELQSTKLILTRDLKNYQQALDELNKEMDNNQKNMSTVLNSLEDKELKQSGSAIRDALGSIRKMTEDVAVQWKEREALNQALMSTTAKFSADSNAFQASVQEEINKSYHKLQIVGSVIGGLLVVLICIVSFVISRSTTRTLTISIDGLAGSSDQIASAAGEVSAAASQLSEGASKQAAWLEEISSSLEEMESMTKQNAGNAANATQFMSEANLTIGKATSSMAKLTASMDAISSASEETQKIIRTIDEIAFQTNLLALNAAVEAARAGEAGAGFAVVADEVRNLAMRAAEAAKNTAGIIESTVARVKEGSDLVKSTNAEFGTVAGSVTNSGGLLSEIAAASKEQADGIAQVNRAISGMETVTQQTAANAEESAAASEEMNAQAEQMKEDVAGLVVMIGGNKSIHNRKGSFGSPPESNPGMYRKPIAGSQARMLPPRPVVKRTEPVGAGRKLLQTAKPAFTEKREGPDTDF
jgi:methyl-accepting chemotaxis protein